MEERIELLLPYQVNAAALENAADCAIFMHCLLRITTLARKWGGISTKSSA